MRFNTAWERYQHMQKIYITEETRFIKKVLENAKRNVLVFIDHDGDLICVDVDEIDWNNYIDFCDVDKLGDIKNFIKTVKCKGLYVEKMVEDIFVEALNSYKKKEQKEMKAQIDKVKLSLKEKTIVAYT